MQGPYYGEGDKEGEVDKQSIYEEAGLELPPLFGKAWRVQGVAAILCGEDVF